MISAKRILVWVSVLALLSLTSCQPRQTPSAGIPVTPEMLESVSRSLMETTSASEPTDGNSADHTSNASTVVEDHTEFDPMTDPVYWTESGSVYHVTDQCSALKHSDHILHGSVEEAMAAKKSRPCKTCS